MKSALPALLALLLLVASTVAAESDDGQWLENLDEALEVARSADPPKNLLVDLWADWCLACKKLEQDVFSTERFQEFAQRYVLLRVDTEDGDEGTRLKQRFNIDALPTTLLLSPDMVKIGALQGYLKTDQYIQNLELERMMYLLLVKAHNEVNDGTDPETTKMMADDFHSRHDGARASSLYRRLVAVEDVDPDEAAWNRFLLADSLRLKGDMSAAMEAVAEARSAAAELEDENLIELVDLLPYQIARDDLRCDAAGEALGAFLRRHPDGQYRKQAEQALKSMRQDQRCR